MAVVKDKKDVSVLLETQLPEFISEKHPKFKKFIEKYYEFMESHQLYFGSSFRFDDDKLVDESDGTSYFLYEDDVRLQLESERDTASNANLMFTLGETLTGNTSGATAVVTGTKGNTIAFVKSTSSVGFVYAEKLTGSETGSYGTLANGIVDGTFPTGSIESFRSRAPAAAIRELQESQDIDTTCDGLIDDAWKKEFYTNVPKTTLTDRRQLLKRMVQIYRSKGNEASFGWLFRSIFAKEDIEFYYPKSDMLNLSDGVWALDKSIKIVTSSSNNLALFTGRKITGTLSQCTAMVEKQLTSFAGALEVTELTLSDVVQGVVGGVLFYFKPNETITSEIDTDGLYADATTSGILQTVTVDVGGTNYIIGDEIHVTGGGGQGARARVASILDSVVEGINVIDSGDGYAPGDLVEFIDDGTGGTGAAGQVQTIISTGAILKNTDIINNFKSKAISVSNFAGTLDTHNANTSLFSNSSLTFSAGIKASSAKLYDSTGNYDATAHILAGDRIAKQVSVNTSDVTLTQSVKTVTLSSGLTEEEKRDVVGGKLTYANANTNIVTGFSSNTVLIVRDTHTIGSGQTFSVDYASNTYWGTVISANTTAFLYSVGSYYRDSDIDALTVQNFVNDDNIIVYNNKFTKLGAAVGGTSADAHSMHNGVTFQAGNTPAAVTTNTFTMVDAHGALPDVIAVCNGALNMTSVDVGAIDTFVLTSGGGGYETSPPVSVANNYTPTLGNALDVTGAPNALLNVNLHSFAAGTIAQDGNVVTLTSEESFPDANSGVLTITYANGATDQITAVTNTTSMRVTSEKIFGLGTGDLPDKQTYSISYMALANNITKNTLLYNDDYSTRGRVLDFIDKSTLAAANPYIANGNTTLRVDMTTAQDFGGVIEHLLLESKNFHNDVYSHEKLVLEHATIGSAQGGGGFFLTEDCVEFISMSDDDDILLEDESRIYTEATTGERVTAHSNSVSTYTTGTMAQSGTTVTGVSTVFPNDSVRGTITYHDAATSTITGWTNTTSFTVADSKTVNAGNTYSISYNSVLTWGINRTVTAAGSGTGNKTVTITDASHYLRTGDKVKITGCTTAQVNGVWPITVLTSNTYSYTLPENGVASPAGSIRSMLVSSVWLATSNAVTMDTSPRGNNAVIEVTAIAIGAIQSAEVYDFGAGYSGVPTLSTTSGDQNAELTAGLGAYATYPGYYSDTKGLLSGVPKIQDNKYYQNFSYVLKTDFDVNDYRTSVKRLIHPSGMIMFGELAIRSSLSARLFDQANNDVDDSGTIARVGVDNTGRKYHNITITSNAAIMNVQFQTFSSKSELEIYTAQHPWQAMDARLEVGAETNLQLENFAEIDSIARTNSTMYVVTETLHGYEAGDQITFLGDESTQQFQGLQTVTTVPTTNTYTITPIADHGALVDQVMYDGYLYLRLEDQTFGNNVIMEDGNDLLMEPSYYLKTEVKAYANTWRASATNWDSPFSGGVLNEDGTEILLERGGSYLYPKIQFPEAESGVTTIDMSFNSDILLEDGYYLLDEGSAGQGNGPQRFISLEEDTQGPNRQYESIPIVDTNLVETLYNSMRQHLISEDGLDRFMYEDEELLTLDIQDIQDDTFFIKELQRHVSFFHTLMEDGSYITNEENLGRGNSYFTVEDNYAIRENNELEVTFHLVETTHWHLRMEDTSHTIYEDGTRMLSEEDYVKASVYEIDTEHYDTLGWHLRMEDDSHLIHEDTTRALIEEGPVKEEKKEIEFNFYETTGWHLMMEDESFGQLITEDGFNLLQESGSGYIVIESFTEDDSVFHLGNEDGITRLLSEQELAANNIHTEIEYNVYESTGYHLKFEDDDHIIYEDGTRLIIEIPKNKVPEIGVIFDSDLAASDLQKWTVRNHGGNIISTYKDTVLTATYGLQPFRPHYVTNWSGAGLGFVYEKFTQEDDTGLIILEHPVTNQNFLLAEDFPELNQDMMNLQREVLDFILLENQTDGTIDGNEFDYLQHEENTNSGIDYGTARALLETAKPPAEGFGPAFTPHQAWTVLPAYQYSRIPKRLKGTITFTDGGTTGTGAASLFTEQLKVGDEFQTANENIIAEDTGGGVLLETDERIEHEEIRIIHVQNEDLAADVLGIQIKDFRWLITTEDTTVTAHGTHAGVIGEYSSWDTALESYWIVTGDSNSEQGLSTETNTAGYPGGIERETPEWEHNNMLWEDLSRQLITEPQAFIVGAITNDTSLTVTRKHLGGTDDSLFLVP